MKNKVLSILLSAGMILVTACHSGGNGKARPDTVNNTYGVGRDTSKTDTSKVTSTTGDAGNLDNSASGGTKVEKDTAREKKDQQK